MSRMSTSRTLTLYQSSLCPYCIKTRKAMKKLDLNIPMKDVGFSGKIRQELIKGGGKPQVPCLRIEIKNQPTQWLYESTDIIRYLEAYKCTDHRVV
ncbi:glutaredoxin family protein [Pseudoteredinibacter isoporae]|uniref:glutaredoxin family protein n=1 Tax=Pseudoteredinibacter isoporae TaxID=570281 RepID=UPI00310BF34F